MASQESENVIALLQTDKCELLRRLESVKADLDLTLGALTRAYAGIEARDVQLNDAYAALHAKKFPVQIRADLELR